MRSPIEWPGTPMPTKDRRDMTIDQLRDQLASAQAREDELVAHVERLRDALQMPCDRWSKHQHKIVKEALESTPAQSLARLRNEAMEEAAMVCDRDAYMADNARLREALQWIAAQKASGAIQVKAIEALAKVRKP